ncbi:YetF domain-containing protein [Planococcus lenghuensis]|uniref:YetF C-terminal domain-containing protein n=1 Tax=Planococcus lenghuensis TaxID=2213202 RepID=A0A1Q2L4F8_9BACL|nr:YetF domain-containing protein [Planococcus lenghuensis]AQQ55306.1 hypothetical protein B0X71_19215 [Planococcus lenghuensis]
MLEVLLYDDWSFISRVILISLLSIPFLLIVKQLGKASVAKMNIVNAISGTIYGIVLARMFITPDISIAATVLLLLALTLLLFVGVKFKRHPVPLQSLAKADPSFLYLEGEFNELLLNQNQLKKEDLRRAMYLQGLESFEQVQAILLDPDGSISVVKKDATQASVLSNKVQRKNR